MFTRIKVQNYKSLINLDVDFTCKKEKAKPLVVIYGENGVGKSNIASVFYVLCESLRTMTIRNRLQKLFDNGEKFEKPLDDRLFRFLKENLNGTESIIKNCKTINSKDNMVLQYDFIVSGGNRGTYIIEYDNNRIVHERLEYVLNKNKTVLYDLTEQKVQINKEIFLDNKYEKEFKELLEKYWGKHTLLSLLIFDKEDKINNYVEERVNSALFDIVREFFTMSVEIKNGNRGEKGTLGVRHEILKELEKGEIDITKEEELNRAERLVNEFFTTAYTDIKEVYYRREYEEDKINYSLVFKKLEYDMLIDVDAELESTGTLKLLEIIPYLLMCLDGRTVVIDEIDNGIHDLLLNNIIENIIESINGQLIITTHNTMLLDSDVDPDYLYTFNVDRDARKTLCAITEYEDRKHPNKNHRKRYLQGMYGGIPIEQDIDFDELKEIMER